MFWVNIKVRRNVNNFDDSKTKQSDNEQKSFGCAEHSFFQSTAELPIATTKTDEFFLSIYFIGFRNIYSILMYTLYVGGAFFVYFVRDIGMI